MNQGLVVAASYATLAAFVVALVIVVLAREPVDPDDPARPTHRPGTAPVTRDNLHRTDPPSDPVQ